jgi:hypothetical protein
MENYDLDLDGSKGHKFLIYGGPLKFKTIDEFKQSEWCTKAIGMMQRYTDETGIPFDHNVTLLGRKYVIQIFMESAEAIQEMNHYLIVHYTDELNEIRKDKLLTPYNMHGPEKFRWVKSLE